MATEMYYLRHARVPTGKPKGIVLVFVAWQLVRKHNRRGLTMVI